MTNQYNYLVPLALCGAQAMTACSFANTDWANAWYRVMSGLMDRHDAHSGRSFGLRLAQAKSSDLRGCQGRSTTELSEKYRED